MLFELERKSLSSNKRRNNVVHERRQKMWKMSICSTRTSIRSGLVNRPGANFKFQTMEELLTAVR